MLTGDKSERGGFSFIRKKQWHAAQPQGRPGGAEASLTILISPDMTVLYLVRHGETVDNANRIMQGQTQGELNDKGRSQAREVAEEMAGTHIDAFVSSDLKRAYDTCVAIAGPHGLGVSTTPLLRERDWGGFTGKYIPDLKDAAWPDDVETVEAFDGAERQREVALDRVLVHRHSLPGVPSVLPGRSGGLSVTMRNTPSAM